MEKYLFPERLAQIRKQKGLSQYELARALDFSRGQIANYEQGTRRPDPNVLQRFADFFNVSVDYLLGRDDADTGNSESDDPELEALFRDLKELDPDDRAIVMAIAQERKRQRERREKEGKRFNSPSTMAAHTASGKPLDMKAAEEVGKYVTDKVSKIREAKARHKDGDNSEKGD